MCLHFSLSIFLEPLSYLFPLIHMCIMSVYVTKDLCYLCACLYGYVHRLQQTFTSWHFPCLDCYSDIFLVSDQSWFSQMSHSLKYTSLNEESASTVSKKHAGKHEKTHLVVQQSHHYERGRVILTFSYIVEVCIDVFFKECSFYDDTQGYNGSWWLSEEWKMILCSIESSSGQCFKEKTVWEKSAV